MVLPIVTELMRNHPLFIGLISTLTVIACSPPKSKSIKVMTWNIWYGGLHGSQTDGLKKETIHPINVYRVIHQESPDVLLKQEFGYTDAFREAHPNLVQTMEGTWGYLSPRDIISDRIYFVYYVGQKLKVLEE